MHFPPTLLGVPSVEIDEEYRQLLTHSIKLGAGNPQPFGHCPECSHGLSCGNLSPDSVPCGPCPRLAWRLEGTGSRMSRSFSTAASGTNPP